MPGHKPLRIQEMHDGFPLTQKCLRVFVGNDNDRGEPPKGNVTCFDAQKYLVAFESEVLCVPIAKFTLHARCPFNEVRQRCFL